jgi:hypothetical protein
MARRGSGGRIARSVHRPRWARFSSPRLSGEENSIGRPFPMVVCEPFHASKPKQQADRWLQGGKAEVVYVAYVRPLISPISSAEPARLPTRLPNATAISRRGGRRQADWGNSRQVREAVRSSDCVLTVQRALFTWPRHGSNSPDATLFGNGSSRVAISVGSETVPMVRRLRRITRKEGLLRGKGGAGRDFAP